MCIKIQGLPRGKRIQRPFAKPRGFSLVEIMVVLVIIALLTGLVAPQFLNQAGEARIKTTKAQMKKIETALGLYRLDNFNYPTTEQGLRALVEKPSLEPIPKNWNPEGYWTGPLPKDPWGNEYRYLSPGERGKFDLYSLGADNLPGGEEEAADIYNWETEDDS